MALSSVTAIFELDGALYRYSGQRLEAVEGIGTVQGAKWLITDMQDAICRTMTVNAAPRYAEVIVRKRMQETGEFEENVAVLSHWKKRKDANTTDICFTALPLRLLSHYQDLSRQDRDVLLVFPLYGVLLNMLRRIEASEPVALVFQHGRFADLIIGSRRQVLYANRCVAFDDSSEQITSLWNTVATDIKTVEAEHHLSIDRLYLLTWLDGERPAPGIFEGDKAIYRIEEEPVGVNGGQRHLSFTRAAKMTPARLSISPFLEKLCYTARQLTPHFNIALLLAAALLSGAFFYYSRQSQRMTQVADRITRTVARLQFETPKDVDQKAVEETLRFIGRISANARTPSFKRLINDVSQSIVGDMTVDVMKVDHAPDQVTLEMYGRINAPFKSAYEGYRQMIRGLQRRGYGIDKNQFDTDINTSRFWLTVNRRSP